VEFKTIERRFSIQSALAESEIFVDKNLTVIPIAMPIVMPFYKTEYRFDSLNEESIETYVRKVFGDDLSFIKSMTSYDETKIYLSNYGQKSLSFGFNGTIIYSDNSLRDGLEDESLDISETVVKGLAFVESIEGDAQDLYLLQTVRQDGITEIYYGTYIEDNFVYNYGTPYGASVVIHVYDNEVVYYSSSRKRVVESMDVSQMWDQGMTFSQIFDLNFETISENFQDDSGIDEILNNREYIFRVVNSIKSFDFEYFVDVSQGSNNVIPAWRMKIEDTLYHIDIYTGHLLGIERE
jgi:hypothetical protein